MRHFNIHNLVVSPTLLIGVKKGFMKEEVLIRLPRRNSSKKIFEEKIENFKISHLREKGYPEDLINSTLKEVTFEDRKLALPQKKRATYKSCLCHTIYQPPVPNQKQILMKNYHLRKQPLPSEIYKNRPLIYKRGRLPKD